MRDRKRNKWQIAGQLFLMLTLVFTCIRFSGSLQAAGAYVSASSNTVYVGDSVTFTVGISNGAGEVNVSGAVSDHIWLDNRAKTYTVKATAAGTLSVSISGTYADYDTAEDHPINASASVTVVNRPSKPSGGQSSSNTQKEEQKAPEQEQTKEETNKSSQADLASLSISEGTLSPKFAADKTSYKASVASDVTSIKVEAKAKDAKATVSGIGEHKLKSGENVIKVKVTAEDGTEKTYRIAVTVEEKPTVYIDYGDKELGVVKNVDNVSKPAGSFEETTVKIAGEEVPAWTSNLMGKTVVYLIDEKSGEKNFYLYDTDKAKVTSIFKPAALLGNNVFIVDIEKELQEREGMKFTTVTVDETTLPGWKYEDKAFADYVLIYVMDETGNMKYYQYEASENTLQLYSGAAAVTVEQYRSDKQMMLYGIIGAGVFAVTTIGALIGCVWMRRRCNRLLERRGKKEDSPLSEQ